MSRLLSAVLAHLAEADGDPEIHNVVVCYELPDGTTAALYSIESGQRAFMEGVMEIAAHAMNSPGAMN